MNRAAVLRKEQTTEAKMTRTGGALGPEEGRKEGLKEREEQRPRENKSLSLEAA